MTSDPRAGFDRIRAPGASPRRAERDADPAGREALFSDPLRRGLRVHCSRCGETSDVGAVGAVRALVPAFVVLPWRDHPVFAVCPACRRRAWLRPRS